MVVNLVQGFFLFTSLVITAVGFLIRVAEPYIPSAIRRVYKYGKFGIRGENSCIVKIEVPKSWFKHFYTYAIPLSIYVLYLMQRVYSGSGPAPRCILYILDILFGSNRKPLVAPEHATLAMLLILFHCSKRLYESHFVSIFSDTKMNIVHYVTAMFHYTAVVLSTIGESQGFVQGLSQDIAFHEFTYFEYAWVLIFFWSTYMQYRTNVILAALRKNKKGEVVTLRHSLPKGGLFDHISAPLQLTEILVYMSVAMVLKDSITFSYIFFWVFVNQAMTGLLNHWWHQETFKNFPPERKVLIPQIF